ncbi:MAG: P-loop NTPase [Propionibacteriaceae bacterium]|jgi:secretion/DNA translocation related CpaE-like protein|nr:P-loop NTPase [Propionibacteriaceae bacterium]
MNQERLVLVLAKSGDLQDLILSAVAAQQLRGQVAVNVAQAAAGWEQAETVFIAEEFAEELAGRALPHRERVYLVGADETRLATWSTPLGAKVIVLPDGVAWLGAVLDEGADRAGSPVVALIGGSGGVGTSTFAAALALSAAKKGRRAALVDVDPLGGGIDLLLGVERAEGWRWPSLRTAEGHIGDIREYLPHVEGVAVVSMARESPADLAKEPLAAIVQAMRRTHDLVVLDAGRSLSGASREAVRLATRRLLLVTATVRGIAAADQVIRAYGCQVEVVLRRPAGAGADSGTVKDLLGFPVVAALPEDKTLALAAERGELAWLSARRSYLRACAALVAKAA